jgi:hypothetical protein
MNEPQLSHRGFLIDDALVGAGSQNICLPRSRRTVSPIAINVDNYSDA